MYLLVFSTTGRSLGGCDGLDFSAGPQTSPITAMEPPPTNTLVYLAKAGRKVLPRTQNPTLKKTLSLWFLLLEEQILCLLLEPLWKRVASNV